MHDPIAYTYEADTHCEGGARGPARGPYDLPTNQGLSSGPDEPMI